MDERLMSLYIPVQQIIVDWWMGELGMTQAGILSFVNGRTLRYGKSHEHIPQRHFLKGIKDRQGDYLTRGVKVGHSGLWRHLDKLSREGLLLYDSNKDMHTGNLYSLNLKKIMEPAMVGKLKTSGKNTSTGNIRRLKVSKRQASSGDAGEGESSTKNGQVTYPKNGHSLAQIGIQPSPKTDSEYSDKNIQKEYSEFRDPSDAGGVVEKVRQDHRLRTERRAATASKSMALKDIKAAWLLAMKEIDAPAVAPTQKELAIFRRAFKLQALAISQPIDQWLVIVVTTWEKLRTGPMAWCEKMPRTPALGFVAYYLRHIVSALIDIERGRVETTFAFRQKKRKEEKFATEQWKSILDGRSRFDEEEI